MIVDIVYSLPCSISGGSGTRSCVVGATLLKVSASLYRPMIESEGHNSYPGNVHKGVVAGGIDKEGLRCDTVYFTSKRLPWTISSCLILYVYKLFINIYNHLFTVSL